MNSNRNFAGCSGLKWLAAGILLSVPVIAVSALSPGFAYELDDSQKPILTLVFLLLSAGVIYLFIVRCCGRGPLTRAVLAWVVIVGLGMRVSMFASTPILEDDHYRYLWDGGVFAGGHNPYTYSPAEVLGAWNEHVPEALRQLAKEAGRIPERINYPQLRTIYPPVAICAFSLAHAIKPWRLAAWRAVLLAADLLTLCLLALILRRLCTSHAGIVIYWWNPLLIKEIYNSAHMDVLLFPAILGALWFSILRREAAASCLLGIAVGVKFWPVMLLPILLRPAFGEPKRLIRALMVFVVFSGAALLPFLVSGLGPHSGFTAYGKTWEMNDSAFMLLHRIVQGVAGALHLDGLDAQTAARALVACLLAGWIWLLIRRNDNRPLDLTRRIVLTIAALFLLSPTQFPWYYLWILPFLAIYPLFPLLLLTPLLSLYYLRYYLKSRGMAELHDHGVVWLEFAPVWGLAAWEWVRVRGKVKRGRGATGPC